jgi:hypothetical protein
VYDMPLVYKHMNTKMKVEKEITLKSFLKRFLEVMKDETALIILPGMIDHFTQDREEIFTKRELN